MKDLQTELAIRAVRGREQILKDVAYLLARNGELLEERGMQSQNVRTLNH